MTWLVVLGNGSWQPEPGVKFKSGKHELPEQYVEAARAAIKRRYPLLLSEVEPQIIRDEDAVANGKPLMAAEVRFPRKRGVAMRLPDAPVVPGDPEPPPSADMMDEFPCDLCVESFPTPDSLLTHIEFDHTADDDGEHVAQGPEGDEAPGPVEQNDGVLGLGKAAAFATAEPEPIPWPEDEVDAPHIPMPDTEATPTVIHDVPVSQGAPPIDRTL